MYENKNEQYIYTQYYTVPRSVVMSAGCPESIFHSASVYHFFKSLIESYGW